MVSELIDSMERMTRVVTAALADARREGYRKGLAAAEQALLWLETAQPRNEQVDYVTKCFRERLAKLKEDGDAG